MSDSNRVPDTTSGGVQLTPKTILALIIAGASLIFIFSNTDHIGMQFLWFNFSAPGWVMFLALFVGGAAVGGLIGHEVAK